MSVDYKDLLSQYTDLQKEFEEFKEDYKNMSIEKIKYDELKIEYDELKIEYDNLKTEYSENVIIQSMNDMKSRYERLIESTVPKYKYNMLLEKYNYLIKYFTAATVLLEHVNKNIKKIDKASYTQDKLLKQIEMEIQTTKSILEDGINL
jgi:CO dehydrogenase/acetyl-CoA synthase delta subunit